MSSARESRPLFRGPSVGVRDPKRVWKSSQIFSIHGQMGAIDIRMSHGFG